LKRCIADFISVIGNFLSILEDFPQIWDQLAMVCH